MSQMSQPETDQVLPPPADKKPKPMGPITAPRVFIPAAGLLVLFVGACAIWPQWTNEKIVSLNADVTSTLGWWYVGVVTALVFFALWLIISPVGALKLARKADDEPDFGILSWFAMLFAAGMGIGLLFYGVAEPLFFYSSPPPGVNGSDPELAQAAMDRTFLHWGLHAWAIYVAVGLAIGYSVHVKGNPISIRWAVEPILGKWARGFLGDVIDVLAVLGTLFGVATSLGFGVSQVAGGISFLGWLDSPGDLFKVFLMLAITAVALVSVVSGVDKGIKLLSNTNMMLAVVFALTVAALAGPIFVMNDYITQVGSYLQSFFSIGFDVMPFQGDAGEEFLGGWTTFYWGWWMSWSPFVGVFIARISRGRTVREFALGVLLVPTSVTFLWFSILGGSAIKDALNGNESVVNGADGGGVSFDLALFQFLESVGGPLSTVLAIIAMILVIVFFVTSSDSGSFVVDMIASGGEPNPPVWSRAFWASMEGIIAAVLMLAGGAAGLQALQTMSIMAAAPFSLVIVLMVIAVARSLMRDHAANERRRRRWLAEDIAKEIGENPDYTTSTTK